MTLTGAFPANTEASLSARRISLLGTLDLWNAEVNDRDGVLTYGAFFNQLVRVESFDAEINQAVTAIKWTITVGYTIFPDESGYAAADFKITEQKDMETGEFVLMISGKIAAATELIARAKLDTVRTASLASNVGYGAAGLISSEIDVGKLSVDDSADAPDGIVFIELNFRETYRKKGNILSWSLTISDDDDVRGGLIRRTYSGSVTAGITGAETAENAYRKALDKARLLGDNKHPFRLSGKVSRGDRKTGVGVQEFVRCEFSFEYQLKGKRIFLEVNSEVATETFGEDTEKVSGFVVAETFILANAAYNTNVRGAYNSPVQRLIRGESKSQSRVKIQNARYNVALVPVSTTGYSPDPAGAEGLSTEDISAIPLEPVFDMWVRLDFSFNVFNKKTAGYAIKYGVDVDVDYVALRKTTTVSGTFFGPDAFLINAEDYSMPPPTSEPALEAFLASLNYGKHINSKRTTDHEHNGTTDYRLHVNFSETYVDKLTSAAQLVQCQVEEETLCSGARFVAQPLPDNEDVVQNCGHEHGTRTVSGTCLATTEGVAMTWVNAQRTGLFNVADALYELPQRLRKSWEFLPLEADPIPGTDEGAGTPVRPGNAMFVRIDFTFTEIVPRMEYS